MFSTEFLLKLLDRDKISTYIYTLLLFSLITVADFFTLYLFSHMFGLYIYLAVITSLSLLGVLILIKLLKKTVLRLEKKHDSGIYPKEEFFEITGLFFSALLIVFPGIISTTIGFILILPYFRYFIGQKLSIRLELDWNAVYEYKEIYSN